MKLFTNGNDAIIAETAESAKKEWSEDTENPIEGADDFYEWEKWPLKLHFEDAPEGHEYHDYQNTEELLEDFPAHRVIFSTEW